MISFLILAAAQASSNHLPPAGPLPAPDLEERTILEPVNAVFAAIASRDAAAMERQLVVGGTATTVTEGADGSRTVQRRTWPEVLMRFQPGPEKFEERLSDPAIESDGSVAMVWGNYVFLIDGKVHHCGIDHFDLVRANGAWKIANVSWSERTTGCPGQ